MAAALHSTCPPAAKRLLRDAEAKFSNRVKTRFFIYARWAVGPALAFGTSILLVSLAAWSREFFTILAS